MNKKTAEKLGLEPCGFGRHQLSRVRNCEQLIHRSGIHRKGCLGFSCVHCALQLSQSPDSSDKGDPGIFLGILNIKKRTENLILQKRDIETPNGVVFVRFYQCL